MKTDKQIHILLNSSPEAFRFLTGGIELSGAYQGRSVAFKELERRADHVFEPENGQGPVYLVEIQARKSGDVYDRLVLELVLYRKIHPERKVYGLALFLEPGCDEPESPWRPCLGYGPLLNAVYLDRVLRKARQEQPQHPLLAACLPLIADERELADQAPTAWRRLEHLDEPGATALMDVFISWLMERYRGKTYEEVMKMLQVLTPLEETRAYQQLVGIGMEKGRQKEALTILTRQLRRRFGDLPEWALERLNQADPEQLEDWAERIFDADDLAQLLNGGPV